MCFTPDLVVQIHLKICKKYIYNCSISNLSLQYMLHIHAIGINYKKLGL